MQDLEWYHVDSTEFNAILESDSMLVIPDKPGIYQWRLRLNISSAEVQSSLMMYNRIKQITERPSGIIQDAPVTSVVSTSIRIGGKGLTEKKDSSLKQFLGKKKIRIYTARFINSLKYSSPILYIGKTENLNRRIREHLNNNTDFALKLTNDYNLKFDDLIFSYCPIFNDNSEITREYLELLEYISQKIVNPFCVERMG